MGEKVKAWAGFSDGKLFYENVDNYFGGKNEVVMLCIYKTRKEARKYFQDVRRVLITEIKPGKRGEK